MTLTLENTGEDSSLFLKLFDHLGEKKYSVLAFYRRIVEEQLENKENSETKLLNAATLTEMVNYFRVELLDPFNEMYSPEERIIEVYREEKTEERDVLEGKLDFMIVFCDIYTQLATFAAEEYKYMLTDVGAMQVTLDLLFTLNQICQVLERRGVYGPHDIKTKVDTRILKSHPFAGYNSKMVALVMSITYRSSPEVEDYFMSPEGKLRLGTILSYTKLDVDNPTLREWCIMTIRNLCSWSKAI